MNPFTLMVYRDKKESVHIFPLEVTIVPQSS